MTDVSCFHNLKTGGIERQLAPGVNARVFPGVHAMLSVVTLEPGARATFRYRIVVLEEKAPADRIEREYQAFAAR